MASTVTPGLSTTSKTSSPTLLTIPPELRLEIYDHFFADFAIADPSHYDRPGILETCKLIQTEIWKPYRDALRDKVVQPLLDRTREFREQVDDRTGLRGVEGLLSEALKVEAFVEKTRKVLEKEYGWIKKIKNEINEESGEVKDLE